MAPVTSEQSQRVAAIFDRVADTYDAVGVAWFTPIAERLVAELAPAAGERAVDIGCGRGAALWPLAAAVGRTGHVDALDLAPRMVEATRADAAARGLDHVTVRVQDAADPQLEAGTYDLVVASLVLFFLPEPLAALRRWRDLLVPGGRIGISSFGDRTPEWAALDDVFTPYLPAQLLGARSSGARGPFADDAGVEGLFTEAGLSDVRTVGFDLATTFDDIEHWRRWSASHGQRAMWDHVPPDAQATVLERASELLAPTRGADGRIRLEQRVRLTLGRST